MVKRKESVLYVRGIDAINGTPLLDIKPYAIQFDHFQTEKNGWLDVVKGNVTKAKSDSRFK